MTLEEAFEKLKKVRDAKVILEEKEAEAKAVIFQHMNKQKIERLAVEGANASISRRKTYEVVDVSLIPTDIPTKEVITVSATDVKKWQDKHATIATPDGLRTVEGEPSLSIRFSAE